MSAGAYLRILPYSFNDGPSVPRIGTSISHTTTTAGSTTNGVVSVASGTFSNAAGNFNADGADANNTVTMTVNTVRPTIAVTSDKAALKAGETATITFTLSAAATDFVAGDVTVSGGTLSGFSGSGTSYTAIFTPTANSTTPGVVSVASAKFNDAAGNQNAGLPLSGIIARKELIESWSPGTHGGTYGGNVVACAAALATLDVIQEERLVERAAERGAQMLDGLRRIATGRAGIGDVRGLGDGGHAFLNPLHGGNTMIDQELTGFGVEVLGNRAAHGGGQFRFLRRLDAVEHVLELVAAGHLLEAVAAEKGLTPSYATLNRVCEALGVHIAQLTQPEP